MSWVTTLWTSVASALRAQEPRLREGGSPVHPAFDAADVGIWICDQSGHQIWGTHKWRELFGFTSSEPLEFDAILQRVHPDDRERLRAARTLAGTSGSDGRFQDEYRLLLPNGETRWISSHGRLDPDPSGQPSLIRGVSSDITSHKNAELAFRDLCRRLLTTQDDERRRIAHELHDNLSQQMAVLAMGIDRVALAPHEPPAALARSMDELRHLAAEISTELHNLSHRLHSSKLEMLGLVPAIKGHCQQVSTPSFNARFQHEGVPATLPQHVQLCVLRVVQEALSNAIRHSEAREADVSIRGTKDALVVRITDMGRGFDPRQATLQKGVGLVSIRERVRTIEGELTIQSRPDHGTTIIARVPIAAGSQGDVMGASQNRVAAQPSTSAAARVGPNRQS